MDELDPTDRGILQHLQTDARTVTNTEIGEHVGVSPTTVGDRIDRLRERGVLKTTYADIDYQKAGIPHTLLCFCTVPTDELESKAEAAVEQQGIVSVTEILTGDRNLLVTVVGSTTEGLAATIARLESLDVVIHDAEILKATHRRPFDGFGDHDGRG